MTLIIIIIIIRVRYPIPRAPGSQYVRIDNVRRSTFIMILHKITQNDGCDAVEGPQDTHAVNHEIGFAILLCCLSFCKEQQEWTHRKK